MAIGGDNLSFSALTAIILGDSRPTTITKYAAYATAAVANPQSVQDDLEDTVDMVLNGGIFSGCTITDAGSLNIDIASGTLLIHVKVTFAGQSGYTLTDDDTNYVYIKNDGTVTHNVTGVRPTGDANVCVGVVVTAGGSISSIDQTVDTTIDKITFTGDQIALDDYLVTPIIYGGTASGDDITIDSTSHSTKGDVLIQPSGGNTGVGESTPAAPMHITVDDDGAAVEVMRLDRTTASPADNDSIAIKFYHENDNDQQEDFAELKMIAADVSDGTEAGDIVISVADGVDGSLDEAARVLGSTKCFRTQGCLELAEQASDPTNVANYAQLYTKSDNGLYYIDGDGNTTVLAAELNQKHIQYMINLRAVTDNQVYLAGSMKEQANTQSGDYATDFAVANGHVYIYVDAITTGGDIVLTGTSISESTGVPTGSDTETITVDTTADIYYMSSKHWLEITNVDVTAGTIAGIDYDIGIIDYVNLGNSDFTLIGYHLEALSDGVNPDMRLEIIKVQADGSKKMSLVLVEDIGIDADNGTNQITDYLRTGGDDRTYNPTVSTLWPSGGTFDFKVTDMETYFASDENLIEGAAKEEGYIIKLQGDDGTGAANALTNVAQVNLLVHYRLGV